MRKFGKRAMPCLLLVAFFFVSGCNRDAEGVSFDELLYYDVGVPIRLLDPGSDVSYKKLEATYYWFGDNSDCPLYTYFATKNSEGQVERVARLLTCAHCGQLVNIDETKGDPSEPVTWAQGGAGACKVLPRAHSGDRITGDPYKSCLYWLDEDLYQYKLYTVWSENESVDFANHLLRTVRDAHLCTNG